METENTELKSIERKLSELQNKTAKLSTTTGVIGILFTIIGLASSIYLAYDNFKTDKTKLRPDSSKWVAVKQNKIEKTLGVFFEGITDEKTAQKFYANQVTDYYLKQNLTPGQIEAEIKSFNSKYPKSKLEIIPSAMSINVGRDTSEVFVEGKFYPSGSGKPKQVIFQVRLDSSNKIYFIRNLKPSSFDSTFDKTFQ